MDSRRELTSDPRPSRVRPQKRIAKCPNGHTVTLLEDELSGICPKCEARVAPVTPADRKGALG